MSMKKKSGGSLPVCAPHTTKTVSMKKAENGYVISCYDDKAGRDRVRIASTPDEAKKIATDMLK